MLGPKPFDPPNGFIFDFHRGIRLAHERSSKEIDAVPNMRRGGHHRHFLVRHLPALERGFMKRPVALADAVLHQRLALSADRIWINGNGYQTVQLVKHGEGRPRRRYSWMPKKSTLLRKQLLPRPDGFIR